MAIRRGIDRIDVERQVVGQGHFLEQPDHEQRQAVGHVLPGDFKGFVQGLGAQALG